MKKLLFSLALFAITIASKATLTFDAEKTYRISCPNKDAGGICIGADHEQNTPLYYLTSSISEADQFWIITDMGSGRYTFKSATTKQYMTFGLEKTDAGTGGATVTKRNLELTNQMDGNKSLWLIEATNEGYVIRSVANNEYRFNVRNNFVLGTYLNRGSVTGNEVFMFYDNTGKLLTDSGSGGESIGETYGTTTDGFYWENNGVKSPVVYTEDTRDPVLYYIKNIRANKYVSVASSNLVETEQKTTAFYFVLGTDGGTNIYTSNGNYISGFIPYDPNSLNISLGSGTTTKSDNTWTLDYYSTENKGYTISVKNCNGNSPLNDLYQSGYLFWNDYNYISSINYYKVDGGGTFIFYSEDSRHKDLLQSYGYDVPSNGTVQTKKLSAYIDSFSIEGKLPVYDKLYKTYMQPIQTKYDGKNYTAKITYKSKEAGKNYTLYINNTKVESGSTYTFKAIEGGKTDSLSLRLNETEVIGFDKITFTFMPIVEVNCPSFNGSTYTTGSIRVNNPENSSMDSLYIAAYKYRGATAQGFSKKAYAIKLRDDKGESVDRTFLGLRSDNNWILDAMAVDPARMRNRVATDLWLDFSTKPYHYKKEPGLINGTRGHFVEVLLNGTYGGIYCMTEKVDRKQLKLKKMQEALTTGETDTIRGVLYKALTWSYSVFMGHYIDSKTYPMTPPKKYNSFYENWDGWEVKYPDMDDMEATPMDGNDTINWQPLWSATNYIATKSNAQLSNDINEHFDIPVFRDYYLFIELLLATDNHAKNIHLFNYNTKKSPKMSLTPWDLDGTWGRRWDGSSFYTKADQDFNTFLWNFEHGEHTIYKRLLEINYDDWETKLANRYKELRQTYFKKDNLIKRFTDYGHLFTVSGANTREQKRWNMENVKPMADVNTEMRFLESWITERLAQLDAQYKYKEPDPIPDGIEQTTKEYNLSACGGKGCILLRAIKPIEVKIYNLAGIPQKTLNVGTEMIRVSHIAPGIYLVNDKTVIVR
ncbi:MAG: CotH kinase family protein [Bacteroidaceae bacterium]